MIPPTESQWARYSALRARLQSVPAAEREATLQALRAAGEEDPQVLSLVALHYARPPDPARDHTGERIGNFALEAQLGVGGMGGVYRAQQHLGPVTRSVAVKFIHPALLRMAREEALARFLAELQTLVTLQHEYIARICDGGIYEDSRTHEHLPYLAMELVHGGLPITTYAKDYALSWQERLAVFVRVCHAVRYAHEHRVVHRDLKPANILVDSDGRPVVIDFGLAQACDAVLPSAFLVASETPAYMSPEQASNTLGAISAKSDVYALGLILYELLTGQHPYVLPRDGSVAQWCQVILEATPRPLRQYNAAYGGELEAIIAAALAKQPGDRIPLVVLRSRLERYLQSLPPARDRLPHDNHHAPRDLQTVSRQSSLSLVPSNVQPRSESGGSHTPVPDPHRLAASHDLDQAGSEPPSPLVQPSPFAAPLLVLSPVSCPDAERRQVTIMFCDLVGATALSGQLDPEDLREVLRAYLETCAEVVARLGGHLEKFLGDGVLIIFGYPQAHEDDPQRAVRAGLRIVEAIARVNTRLLHTWGVQLAVRVGIHTGLVVVGELRVGEAREPQAIVGEAPNIAARLQELTAPNTVVLSAATARLVDGYFTLEVLGPQALKGVAIPMSVYRVIGESDAQTRLDVAMVRGLTPLVGREPEVTQLLERWTTAKHGRGQVVVMSGEAGIGKSRLVQVFTAQLTGETYTRIVCYCLPDYQQSAFYPVIEHLQQVLQLRTDDTPAEKLRKLEAKLEPYDFALEEVLPLLATLLSLPLPARYPPLTLTPQRQKQKTLEILLAWLLKEAEQQPVCVVIEDLHWGDPSTLEWLSLLIAQIPTVRVLLLLLFRPEFQPPWALRSYITPLALSRLSNRQTEGMIGQVAGGKRLPAEVVQHLVATTDGVPLFIEELTKMVLESGLLREVPDHYELTGPLPALAIPTTLQDTLMTRLDRLGAAKSVAQLGATVGRTFAYALLQALTPLDDETLQRDLGRLVEAELLYQCGLPPQATYLFKHALIQEAAYQSLLKSTRKQYHQRIAQVLATDFPETVELQPELLAHHYTEAGLVEHAIPYWQSAGQRASQRSAHMEAISHLTKGLELLQMLPDIPERTQHELSLCLALGVSLAATKGYATPDVVQVYTRARTLCQQVGNTPQLFLTLRGLQLFYFMRGEPQTARELGEQLLTLAYGQPDPARQVAAHMAVGQVLFVQGNLAAAREHLAQGLALYDSQQHHYPAWPGGHPGVSCAGFITLVLWLMGYPDQALTWNHTALTWAQQLSHSLSLALVLAHTVILHHYRREGHTVQQRIDALVTLSTEQSFTLFAAVGTMAQGWALVERAQEMEGLAQMRQGLEAFRATGIAAFLPYVCAVSAEIYGKIRQPDEGLRLVAEALALVANNGERFYAAELYRLQGELLLARSPDAETEAVACFHQALTIAREQHAKSLELRAAMSLSRQWQRQGKREEAYQLLADVYAWFSEGLDTADLQEAKALLEELTSRTNTMYTVGPDDL